MIRHCVTVFALVLSLALLASCVNDVSGTYQRPSGSMSLTLTKDGKFIFDNGDSGTYTVEGKTIVVTNPLFGGAKGEIRGNSLYFPFKKREDFVGSSFSGKWTRK